MNVYVVDLTDEDEIREILEYKRNSFDKIWESNVIKGIEGKCDHTEGLRRQIMYYRQLLTTNGYEVKGAMIVTMKPARKEDKG